MPARKGNEIGKECTKCKTFKPYADFTMKKDGYRRSYCKPCQSKASIEYQQTETGRENARYNQATFRIRHLDHVRQQNREYAATETGRENQNRRMRKYYVSNKKKALARAKVQNAVRTGSLIKPDACWHCGSELNIEAHHADYDNALGVVWLCRMCHRDCHLE